MEAVLDSIIQVFEKMKSGGFPIDSPLKWGFYFVDDTAEGLERVFDELRDHGYKLEHIEAVEDGLFQLFASKCEVLDAERLHRRNVAFNDLAETCNVMMYDGWDVEKVPS